MLKVSIAALAASLALLTTGFAQAAAPDEATVRSGALKGVVLGDVVAFKGIPYAAPPVGDLRWRPPQPAAAWTGVRQASAFGPVCIQSGGMFGGGANQSEDCLTVNVWTQLHHEGRKLPVMVWIHGGGFVGGSGSASYYDGASFARDGVVLVSLNYRLGRFGFFAHPALAHESPNGPLGNYGIMDQIAALKWVKANVAAFGGDPDNVTAFGESAGGISLNFLMASRDNKGLFERAISESGFGRFDAPPIVLMQAAGAAYAKTQGVEGDDAAAAAALRALPVSKLTGSITSLSDPGIPRPMIDGVVIKERVDDAFAAGRQLRVPYIVGGNSFEASLFAKDITAHPEMTLAQIGPDTAKTTALFDDGDPLHAAFNISTETMISEPNRFLARMDAKAGAKVYLYYFSYVPAAQRAAVPGAGHGSEIGYVFETLPMKSIVFGARTIAAATPADLAVAKAIHAYWVSFAKTGSPDSAGGIRWPPYQTKSDDLLEFGAGGVTVQEHFLAPRLDVIAEKAATARR
jgi:para-nitrobenzyl esterase